VSGVRVFFALLSVSTLHTQETYLTSFSLLLGVPSSSWDESSTVVISRVELKVVLLVTGKCLVIRRELKDRKKPERGE